MSTLQLPKSSRILVVMSACFIVAAGVRIAHHESASLLFVVLAFFASGFLADAFTGLAHFGFDYVFPDKMPILGPIAMEFREHHDYPTLDPSNYTENLTKGPGAVFRCRFWFSISRESIRRVADGSRFSPRYSE